MTTGSFGYCLESSFARSMPDIRQADIGQHGVEAALREPLEGGFGGGNRDGE